MEKKRESSKKSSLQVTKEGRPTARQAMGRLATAALKITR